MFGFSETLIGRRYLKILGFFMDFYGFLIGSTNIQEFSSYLSDALFSRSNERVEYTFLEVILSLSSLSYL